MKRRKVRWLIYVLIGIVFGIIDYYVQLATTSFTNATAYVIVAFGVWLIPVVPIAIYEIKASASLLRTVLASVLTWLVAVFVYYLYILLRLMFVGQESMMFMHISNADDPFYWQNISSFFFGSVLGRTEWLYLAIIGGALIGLLVAVIYRVIHKKRA